MNRIKTCHFIVNTHGQKGYSLIELAVATVVIGLVFATFIPLTLAFMNMGTANKIRLSKIESLERIADKIRHDVRCGNEIYIRENLQGFLLKIHGKEKSPVCIAYNIHETEPGVLYRSEFVDGKECLCTRILGNIQEWKISAKGENPRQIMVEIVFQSPKGGTGHPYVITACMRTNPGAD